jgi:hypothetical protein
MGHRVQSASISTNRITRLPTYDPDGCCARQTRESSAAPAKAAAGLGFQRAARLQPQKAAPARQQPQDRRNQLRISRTTRPGDRGGRVNRTPAPPVDGTQQERQGRTVCSRAQGRSIRSRRCGARSASTPNAATSRVANLRCRKRRSWGNEPAGWSHCTRTTSRRRGRRDGLLAYANCWWCARCRIVTPEVRGCIGVAGIRGRPSGAGVGARSQRQYPWRNEESPSIPPHLRHDRLARSGQVHAAAAEGRRMGRQTATRPQPSCVLLHEEAA